jgi:hypothetical protein
MPGKTGHPEFFLLFQALSNPFTILTYMTRIVGINTLKGFNPRVSTEPFFIKNILNEVACLPKKIFFDRDVHSVLFHAG